MQISIIHFSDIHFQNGHNVVTNKLEKIFDSIKNRINGTDELFILTSGDIANTGNVQEYNIAYNFYEELIQKIEKYVGKVPALLFVPGNHDLEFNTGKDEVRNLILEKFQKEGLASLSENLINECIESQKNYFDFVSRVQNISITKGSDYNYVLNHPLANILTFKAGDQLLKFSLFNTSWTSEIRERIGNIKYPLEYMESKFEQANNAVSISVLHHPLNWHTPEYSDDFLDFLLQTSDLVCSGHEHKSKATLRSDIDNNYNTICVESPALQETGNTKSSFNLIKIDIENFSIKLETFQYDEKTKKNYLNIGGFDWKKIAKEKKLKSKDFQLKAQYKNKLEDPGAKYTHKTADAITLKDLYVPPFLQIITMDEGAKKSKGTQFIKSESIFSFDPEEEYYSIILGSESSGKTALLKYQYLTFFDHNLYPVYIPSGSFNNIDIEKVKSVVRTNFEDQYDQLDKKFDEIDYSLLVLLVDDFHNYKNQKAKASWINTFKKIFKKVILVGNEIMMFETIKDQEGTSVNLYEKFEWFIIKEFNPSLRYELINKWYRLGRDYMDLDERNDFYRTIDYAKENIDNIIGKNLVPSYPIYLLAILQALESGESTANSNKQHAYYYELLITNSLKKALKEKDEIGFYFTLCKEYFYFLFDEKIRFKPIDKASFKIFLNYHKKEYSLSQLNEEEALEILTKSRILKIDQDNQISIGYKYLYYYFVAKYFADNIDDADMQRDIDLMADRVYRDEFSNILIFLIHLSRNNYVIAKLIEKATSIFSTKPPVRLDSDIEFINELQNSLPDAVYASIDIDQARSNDLVNEDKQEELELQLENEKIDENYELTEDISNLDHLATLTRALRTLDILGQLTKKYWGELKGPQKLKLAEETFLLGLRTLRSHFDLLDDSDGLVEYIKKSLLKKISSDKLSTEKVENWTGNFIFSLCSTVTFSIFKRIANSIGTEKLIDTYFEIEQLYPFNSVKITIAGIKLDHFRGFPMSDLEKIKNSNESNILALVVLRNFIIDHLYMYDLSLERRQQICDKFGIKMEEQRFISGSSQVKK